MGNGNVRGPDHAVQFTIRKSARSIYGILYSHPRPTIHSEVIQIVTSFSLLSSTTIVIHVPHLQDSRSLFPSKVMSERGEGRVSVLPVS